MHENSGLDAKTVESLRPAGLRAGVEFFGSSVKYPAMGAVTSNGYHPLPLECHDDQQ